jgi:hypothetical protein
MSFRVCCRISQTRDQERCPDLSLLDAVKRGKDARRVSEPVVLRLWVKNRGFQAIVAALRPQKGARGFDRFLVGLQESGTIAAPADVRFRLAYPQLRPWLWEAFSNGCVATRVTGIRYGESIAQCTSLSYPSVLMMPGV